MILEPMFLEVRNLIRRNLLNRLICILTRLLTPKLNRPATRVRLHRTASYNWEICHAQYTISECENSDNRSIFEVRFLVLPTIVLGSLSICGDP